MISNRNLINYCLSLRGGYCGFSDVISVDPEKKGEEDIWRILKTRVEEFLRDKSAADEVYKGKATFPYPYRGLEICEIERVVLGKKRTTIRVNIYYKVNKPDKNGISCWVCGESIRISDFCDPEYIEKYVERLRTEKMKKLETKIKKKEEDLARLKKIREEMMKKEEGKL